MSLPGNERNFLCINKQRKSNEAIYDVRYSRISGGIRGSSEKTDLSGENQLILLGDYIDYGPDGRAVLEKVRALQEKYSSEKVIALMGNHEKALLDWLEEYADVNRHIGSVEQYRSREWLTSDADGDYETLHSFLKEEHFQEFLEKKHTSQRIPEMQKQYG